MANKMLPTTKKCVSRIFTPIYNITFKICKKKYNKNTLLVELNNTYLWIKVFDISDPAFVNIKVDTEVKTGCRPSVSCLYTTFRPEDWNRLSSMVYLIYYFINLTYEHGGICCLLWIFALSQLSAKILWSIFVFVHMCVYVCAQYNFMHTKAESY